MARDDWYRNREWNADVEATYRRKLSRSRSGRPQYLTIQAGYLSERDPAVALALIDEYFGTGDKLHVPQALCVRAEAHLAMGNDTDAIAEYKQALDWEAAHPNFISTASTSFPVLVAEMRLTDDYDYALKILTSRFSESDLLFPATEYMWNGSFALIAHEKGEVVAAREFAERAIRAATKTESPFRYHRKVGLVPNASHDFGRRIKDIAKPSKVPSWMRYFSRS